MTHPTSSPLSFDTLPFEQARRLDRDWFGDRCHKAVSVLLLSDEASDSLWLAGASEPAMAADPTQGSGDFIEGLWEGELIEAFLYSEVTGRYLEINLAPSGAWWSAVFAEPRQRESVWHPAKAQAMGQPNPGDWKFALRLPFSQLCEQLGNKPTHANLTAITISAGSTKPAQVQFLSLAKLSSDEPDFHRPLEFLPFPFL